MSAIQKFMKETTIKHLEKVYADMVAKGWDAKAAKIQVQIEYVKTHGKMPSE